MEKRLRQLAEAFEDQMEDARKIRKQVELYKKGGNPLPLSIRLNIEYWEGKEQAFYEALLLVNSLNSLT